MFFILLILDDPALGGGDRPTISLTIRLHYFWFFSSDDLTVTGSFQPDLVDKCGD